MATTSFLWFSSFQIIFNSHKLENKSKKSQDAIFSNGNLKELIKKIAFPLPVYIKDQFNINAHPH